MTIVGGTVTSGSFLSESAPRRLLVLDPKGAIGLWDQVEPIFRANPQGWSDYTTLESIKAQLAAGDLQLWTLHDGEDYTLAFLSEGRQFPRQNLLRLVWMGGEGVKDLIEDYLEFIELWAKRSGFTRIEISGPRKAAVKLLAPHGYTNVHVVVQKDISGITEH